LAAFGDGEIEAAEEITVEHLSGANGFVGHAGLPTRFGMGVQDQCCRAETRG
jgi:hypothetical protein